MSVFRIIFDIAAFICIFLLPWWAVAVIVLFALFFFDRYFEILIFGFVFDSLYSATGKGSGISAYLFSISAFVVLAIEIVIKDYIRV